MRLLFLALCAAAIVGASPIVITTPILLTGSGTFKSSFLGSFGDAVLFFHASGSNGTDTISVSGEIPSFNDFGQIYNDPDPVGSQISLAAGYLGCQVLNFGPNISTCNISIDGIIGFGLIDKIGGGLSMVHVYQATCGPSCGMGPLLAEAAIKDFAIITSYTIVPTGGVTFPYSGTFNIVADAPEPSAFALCLSGVLFGLAKAMPRLRLAHLSESARNRMNSSRME